jgi:Domain of unknown function (DUF4169)
MGQVVNLRTHRRRAVRQQASDEAAANRVKHGRSKAQRTLDVARSAKASRDLDGHRTDTGDQE